MLKPEHTAMMAAIQAAVTGAKEGSFTLPTGEQMLIEKSDDPDVKAVLRDASGKGITCTIYEPSPTRPAGYPATLPFLPNAMAGAGSENPTQVFATWFGLKNFGGAFTQLTQDADLDGWLPSPSEQEAPMLPGMQIAAYRRGNVLRTIMAAGFGPFGFAAVTDKTDAALPEVGSGEG